MGIFKMNHRTLMLYVLITILFPLPCFSDQKVITIGATVSISGRHVEPSDMIQKGYNVWVDQINRNGGLLGKPVKLIFYDDQSKKNFVGRFYKKLIQEDKVDLVLSPYGSPLTMAASDITEQFGYPMLACAAASEKVWVRGYKYIFGIYALADRYFIGFQDLLARSHHKRLGLIYENSVFHQSIAQGVRRWADRFDLKLVLDEPFSNPANQFKQLLNKLKTTPLEGFVFSGYTRECYSFIDLMKTEGIKPIATSFVIAPIHPKFHDNVGEFSENIFSPSQWEPDKRLPFPGTQQFIDEFTTRYKTLPSYHAASAYSSCQILENAVKNIQQIDREKIRDYISTLDTITIMGRFKVDHTGRQIGHNPILIQWQNGKKQIVYPTKMATSPPKMKPVGE